MPAEPTKSLRLLMHPYSTLVPVREGRPELKEAARLPGSALVWVLEQGVRKVDRMLVDLGLERDRGRRFALWTLLYMLDAAPDLYVAFKDETDREAARNMMDMIAAATPD